MIRLLTTITLLFTALLNVQAQQKQIDELHEKLKNYTKYDTAYINTLADLGVRYQHSNTDSMLAIGKRVLSLSTQINYVNGIGHGYKILGIAFINLNNRNKALYNDSLAAIFYQKAGNRKGLGAVYNNMAVLFNSTGELYTAKTFYEKSLAIRKELNDLKGIGDCYNNLGNNAIALGKLHEASPYLTKSLEIRKQLNDKSGIVTSLMNLGNLHYYLGNYTKSKQYYSNCLRLAQTGSNIIKLGEVYNNIGAIFFDNNQTDSAEYYFTLSLKASKDAGDYETVISAINNLAETRLENGDYASTLALLNEAKNYLVDTENGEAAIILDTKYVQYFLQTKNYNQALKIGEQAAKKAKDIGALRTYIEILELIAKVHASSKNFEDAYYTQRAVKIYADSMMNDQIVKSLSDFQYKYDIEQKEHLIKLLEKEKLYEGEKNKKLSIAFTLSIFLLGLVSSTLYVVYANRRKERHIRALIQEQNQSLDEHNQFKNRIFSIIAHDLRSPVASTITMFDLLNKQLFSSKEFAEIQLEIGNQIKQMALLLDNLLSWSKKQMKGKLEIHPSTIIPFNIAQQNIELLQPIYHKKQLTIKNELAIENTLFIDPDQLDIIIRNLLSNAMKFSSIGGEILLTDNQTQDYYELSIRDNGIGMDQETLDNLFTTKTIVKRGTKGEKGTGIGLSIVKEFIEVNNGTISVFSQPSEGTLFKLKFNLSNSTNT